MYEKDYFYSLILALTGFSAKVPGKIIVKDISLTAGGKNYTNVIHTQVKLKYEIPLIGIMEAMTYDYYAAKGIGIVKIVSEADPIMMPGVGSVAELIEYNIK